MDMISFLHTVSVEAQHFVDNCLDKEISIDSVESQVKSSTVENLNKTKENLDKVFNTP